jgi:hypothetical protein
MKSNLASFKISFIAKAFLNRNLSDPYEKIIALLMVYGWRGATLWPA